MKFGLKESTINSLLKIFSEFQSIERVIIYGSRAKGNFKNGSDIDLTIVGEIDFNTLLKIENEIEDLLLPYKIDISLHHQIENKELTDHINRRGKVIYEKLI